ncbi:MAG: alpha/beta hydrolase [Candidatus Kariarchaeaceae archaeon]
MRRSSWQVLIPIVLIFTSTIAGFLIQTDFGNLDISRVHFKDYNNESILGILYKPDNQENHYPGVVVVHGLAASKEMMRDFAIELVRRGMIVLTIDLVAHGHSSGMLEENEEWYFQKTITSAINFLRVEAHSTEEIGLVGHSLGGGAALQEANANSYVQATVVIGNSLTLPDKPENEWSEYEQSFVINNGTKNVLGLLGRFDEVFSVENARKSFGYAVGEDKIEINKLYGNFNDGTARKLTITSSNHLIELIEPQIIEETYEWMMNSFNITSDEKPLVYIWVELCSLLGSIAIAFLIFIKAKTITEKKEEKSEEEKTTFEAFNSNNYSEELEVNHSIKQIISEATIEKSTFKDWIKYIAIFGGVFIVVIPFNYITIVPPMLFAQGVVIWLIILGFIWRKAIKSLAPFDFLAKQSFYEIFTFLNTRIGTKMILYFTILYSFIWTVDTLLIFDFRFVTPIFVTLSLGRALSASIIIIAATWFFYWDNIMVQEIIFRPTENSQGSRNMLLKAILLRVGLVMILIIINFILKLSGILVLTGFLGLTFHMLLDAIPYYIYISTIGYYISHKKGNWYLAAWIQGILFGWIMAASFPMAFLRISL